MARPTAEEITVIGKNVCCPHSCQEKEACHTTGYTGKHQARSGGRRREEEMWTRVLLWFLWEGMSRIGEFE